MSDTTTDYGNAVITWGGPIRGPDDRPITTYCMVAEGQSNWFVGEDEYTGQGSDFFMAVSNFGHFQRDTLDSTSPLYRREFTAMQRKELQKCIYAFFTGAENKDFFPYRHPKARCLGVSFHNDWIICK